MNYLQIGIKNLGLAPFLFYAKALKEEISKKVEKFFKIYPIDFIGFI